MKTCKNCGVEKPLTEFYKHSQMADGHLNHCKDCKRAYQRTRSRDVEYDKAYYARTTDTQKARVAKWREENRERHNAWNRQWEINNADYIRGKGAKRRALKRQATVEPLPKNYYEMVMEFYGNRCLFPGCGATERLELDHVVSLIDGGAHIMDNFQPLCKSHNASKGAKSIDYRSGKRYAYDTR